MKKIILSLAVSLAAVGPCPIASATVPAVRSHAFVQISTESIVSLLDKAVASNAKGDKTETTKALQDGTAALETEAKTSTGSLKDKLSAQVGNLKKLIPLAQSGLLKGDVLQKAVSLVKMALGANQIEKLIGGGNLVSKISGLTSNLNLVKTGFSALGGSSASNGNSLVNTALSGLTKLGKGGPLAKAAEPAVKGQLDSVIGFVKDVL